MCRCNELWTLLLCRYLEARTLEHRQAAVTEILQLEAAITASVATQKQLVKVRPPCALRFLER